MDCYKNTKDGSGQCCVLPSSLQLYGRGAENSYEEKNQEGKEWKWRESTMSDNWVIPTAWAQAES